MIPCPVQRAYADHLDFFKNLQDVERSFRKFASLVPADGLIVANGDDKNTRDTLAGMPYLSFGFDAKNYRKLL